MKVMVLGASGALGRAVSQQFSSFSNCKVYRCGRNVSPFVDVGFDILDWNSFVDHLNRINPDIIINSAHDYSNSEQSQFVNLLFPIKLMQYFEANNKYDVKLLFVGSAAEYGLQDGGEKGISETSELLPITQYGMQKMLQTKAIEYFARKKVQCYNARLFNLYGEGISENLLPGILSRKIREYKSGIVSQIFLKDLSQYRDFISTEAAASLIANILSYGKSGEAYNVASGKAMLVRDFVRQQLAQEEIHMDIVRENTDGPVQNCKEIMFANVSKVCLLKP